MNFFSALHPALLMSAAWTRFVRAARSVPAPIATMAHPAVSGPGVLRAGAPNPRQPMTMIAGLGGRPWHPDWEQAQYRSSHR
jgi:hypothetical protein